MHQQPPPTTPTIESVTRAFHTHEHHFFTTLPPSTRKALHDSGLNPSDLFHFGEFAFLLGGLKACVLVYIPVGGFVEEREERGKQARTGEKAEGSGKRTLAAVLTEEYVKRVWEPVLALLQGETVSVGESSAVSESSGANSAISQQQLEQRQQLPRLELCEVTEQIRSVHMDDYRGAWICYDRGHPKANLIKSHFGLGGAGSTAENKTGGRSWRTVSEKITAELLDYPGTLPLTEEEAMTEGVMEVAYLGGLKRPSSQMDGSQDTLLTTYVALPKETADVKRHFLRYQNAVGDFMNMKLVVRR